MTPKQKAAVQYALAALKKIRCDALYEQDCNTCNAEEALRAALAEIDEEEPDLSRCPKCLGPADNGHDRCIPPNPYYCTKCMGELDSEVLGGKDE